MLDTFRKRVNDNQRPPAAGAGTARPLLHQPQLRVPDPMREASQPDRVAAPAAVPEPAQAAQPAAEALPAQPSAARSARESARLIVGPDIKLNGAEITDCDTLIVEGQVDASMDSRVIEVAEQGVFRGKVQVEIAEIRGRFEGELTAMKQLMIRAGGTVVGKIRYGKLQVDEGGEISGDIGSAASFRGDTRTPSPAPAKLPTA